VRRVHPFDRLRSSKNKCNHEGTKKNLRVFVVAFCQ
jgi:hypothetical protein